MDSGDLATWVGSCFAAIAAGATLWTLKSQRDQIGEQREFIAEQSQNLELERAELRAAAEDRKWAQARQVLVRHYMAPTGEQGAYYWKVTIKNPSDAPVHDVEVRFGAAYIAAEVHEVLNTESLGERWTIPVHLLGAGRTAQFNSQRWPEATAHNNRPVVAFSDDSGLRWALDSYGKLEEAPSASVP